MGGKRGLRREWDSFFLAYNSIIINKTTLRNYHDKVMIRKKGTGRPKNCQVSKFHWFGDAKQQRVGGSFLQPLEGMGGRKRAS